MTNLPNGWALARLSEVAEWSSGGTPRAGTPAYYGGGIPWAVIGDLNDGRVSETASAITALGLKNSSAKIVDAGTVLVAMYGSIGKLGVAQVPMATNQAIACAVPNEAITRDWLFWWLRSQRHELLAAGKGGTQSNISQTVLKAWPIPVAPRAEQERIVTAIEEAFSKLDAGEAGLRTVRQLLKRMREAILTAAVTGHLVSQDPTDTPAAKLLADLGAGPVVTADLASIPEGWAGVALGDLAEVISGPAFKSTQFKEAGEGTRLLRGENIEPGQLRWRDTRTWPDALLPGHEHLHVEVSDLILAMDRPVISTGLKLAPVRPADLPALLVQRVARIRPKTDCLRSFLLITMQHSRFVSHLLGGQVGTQLPHITLKGIREFTLACPGPEEMARIVAEVERQLSFVEACERAVDVGLARAAGLRRSVLKAAFEGRLVPQDPSDEPAPVLLDRIRAERKAKPVAKRRARQTA